VLNSACLNSISQLDSFNGIHLTGAHLYDAGFIETIRTRFPKKIISASCHQPKDIEQANQKKVDFIVLSPVHKTASHPQQDPMGWDKFESLCELVQMPCFALGGMSVDDISQAQLHGAQGISGISSLWHSDVGKLEDN